MNAEQKMVLEFHKTFLPDEVSEKPTLALTQFHELRVKLIDEENEELKEGLEENNLEKVADAIADLLYVVYGTAVTFGIDMEPIFKEVHRSNMTKKGGYLREDGKWVKPETYDPPNLNPILEKLSE